MAQDGGTTIRIKKDTWQSLHDLKSPGESHDDVIQSLLQKRDGDKETEATADD